MKRNVSLSEALLLVLAGIVATFLAMLLYIRTSADEESEAQKKLAEAMAVIESNYIGEYDEQDVVDGAISGMIDSLGDRWSYYLTKEELASYLDSFNNQYTGIGIVIEGTDNGVLVTQVYEDSPAAEAGVVPGDRVISVNGESVEALPLDDVSARVAAALAQGSVQLGLRAAAGTDRQVEITPQIIEVNPVSFQMLDGGIGYVKIDNFESRCASQVVRAVATLRTDGVRALIFDVRNNPGGQLNELLQVLDYLLPSGEIFLSRDNRGVDVVERSEASCVELPMAVLVNSETYSAAEFFAAALQEYEWATIVGEQTTGKGYAQITLNMSDGSAIHISAREYFTPKGASLANVGVTPDCEIPLDEEKFIDLYYGRLPQEEDDQLQAAINLFLTE